MRAATQGANTTHGWHTFLHRNIRDALDGVPHEKFLRIVGLFDAVVAPQLKNKNSGGTYANPVVHDFDKLRKEIESKLMSPDRAIFKRDEFGDYVHNLNLLLGALLPAPILENALPIYRDDFRSRVSAEVHAAYMSSPAYKMLDRCERAITGDSRLQLLRTDYIYLINEIRKLTLQEYHIEETRSFLIRKLRWTLFKLLIVPFLISCVFLAGRGIPAVISSSYYKPMAMLTLLSLAAIAGATGSFISALLRIEAVPESSEIARNVVGLRYSESIRLAPVTGFVFAILLSLIFGGGLVNGLLFPQVPGPHGSWPLLVLVPAELAKWLAWSFVVGFSERLMPDMIDRLVKKADKSDETSAPPTVSGGMEPFRTSANGVGINGAVPVHTHALRRPKRRGKRHAQLKAV